MDYTWLFRNTGDKKSRVGIIGATKGYGYTLLAQIPKVGRMELRLISSRHTDECVSVLTGLEYPEDRICVCRTEEEVRNAPKDAVIIVQDYRLALASDITAIVECTGNTAVGADISAAALRSGINVYMVSKETDSVCGPMLNRIADQNGTVYSLVNGDQPRNLVDLISWGRMLGLEIVCAGKATEYDYVWDPRNGDFNFTDGTGRPAESIPGLKDCWYYEGLETLKQRDSLLLHYKEVVSADLCEMNLVSNITGMVPADPRLCYPICKISELPEILVPVEDGGILEKTGTIAVFCDLRAVDEASFGGGEFIIVKCENQTVWQLLAGKGHVVSRNGKYCCIYLPYHYMGVETPSSILLGDLLGLGTHPECRQVTVLAGVADQDIPAGTELWVHGHHHAIDHLIPELRETAAAADIAPFYLLNGCTLTRDLKKGEPVTRDAVRLKGFCAELFEEGLKL